jgi:copper chaperone
MMNLLRGRGWMVAVVLGVLLATNAILGSRGTGSGRIHEDCCENEHAQVAAVESAEMCEHTDGAVCEQDKAVAVANEHEHGALCEHENENVKTVSSRAAGGYDAGAAQNVTQATFRVTGLMCTPCTDQVAGALKAVPGVTSAAVSLNPPVAKVSYDPNRASLAAMKAAVQQARHMHSGDTYALVD